MGGNGEIPKTTFGRLCVVLHFLLVFVGTVVGCDRRETTPDAILERSSRARSSAGRLVVLGVDGLDFRVLDEMVESGDLPAFAGLYRHGSVGRINVLPTGLPLESPRIWTSFATGQLPEIHGISSFVYTDFLGMGSARLYSSQQRRSPAIWEIASEQGKSVGVVNWWVTYPAEPVDGFVISDRYVALWARRRARFWGAEIDREREKSAYPPSLADTLDTVELSGGNKGVLGPRAAEEKDRHIFDLAAAALVKYPVELVLIYTRALDELSHMRWHTHEPLPGESPPKIDAIADYMRRYDRLLAGLIDDLGPDDHLVLLSDHGFERKAGGGVPSGAHASADTAVGVMILYGPRIRSGARLGEVGVLDVLPTLLEIADLPAARDMPGRVLAGAFKPALRKTLPRVAAYERNATAQELDTTSKADGAIIERLRALGYMHEDPGD